METKQTPADRFRGRHAVTRVVEVGILAVSMLLGAPMFVRADRVDDVIATEMQKHNITGLSLAIIDGGNIVKAKSYGFTDVTGETLVTKSTLFQAGSVSKSVAAVGALRLVQDGKLSLDEDVNTRLKSWKVPENEFTREQKVTLRRILSHTAGLTVHGFPGYASGSHVPTLTEVLDGLKPANTAAVRVETVPGTHWKYSGGGYTVMQEMLVDVTGQPFPEFMRETVLKPFGMTNSTYEQPLPESLRVSAATGHQAGEYVRKGGVHVYPEMAAAGLWTTASDLARFAIGIQRALAGKTNGVISPPTARLMLTNVRDYDGLGVFLGGSGKTLRFFHTGRDWGFDASMNSYAETGQGAVIMINTNDNSKALNRIMLAIAREYRWQ